MIPSSRSETMTMKEQPPSKIEFFPPPSQKLRDKVMTGSLSAPAVDLRAVARGEQALVEVADACRQSFGQAVASIRDALAATDPDGRTMKRILRAAMEIKGLSAAYDKPLVVDVAVSLIELLDRCRTLGERERKGITLHLDALEAACRDAAGTAGATRSDAAVLFGKLNDKIKAGSGG